MIAVVYKAKRRLGATKEVDKRGGQYLHPLPGSSAFLTCRCCAQTAIWRLTRPAYDSPFRWAVVLAERGGSRAGWCTAANLGGRLRDGHAGAADAAPRAAGRTHR